MLDEANYGGNAPSANPITRPNKFQKELYPFDAFSFDDPNKTPLPVLELKSPWRLRATLEQTGDTLSPRGYIDGLTLSNATDTEHDISIAAGKARDSTDVYTLTLSSAIVKRIDAAWSAGTNAGGLDTGSVAAKSVYYLWLIRKDSDQTIDALFSLSKTAPTMPSGYTYKRRIGTVLTDASANIIPFDQFANGEVRFRNPIDSRALGGLANTSRNAFTVTAPPSTVALLQVTAYNGADTAVYYMWAGSAERTDAAASATNYTHLLIVKYGACGLEMRINTNASKQVYVRGTSTNIAMGIVSLGWIDDRGRDA